MTFDDFSRLAQEAFQNIPAVYRDGVDGVTTVQAKETHPELPDVVTLGECLTHGHISDWQGPETTRSRVMLYYGSFRHMAKNDPDFDWEAELWETLTHELQHHLESLADEDALEALDYAMDESFKRGRGEPFDPWYYRWGEALEALDFAWKHIKYRTPRPDTLGDIHFVIVHGIGPRIQIVLIQRPTWKDKLKGFLGSEAPVLLKSAADACVVD